MEINDLTHLVIGCAYKVHNTVGSAFLERIYENALKLEIQKSSIEVLQHAKLPVLYEGHLVGVYYPDLWVEKQLSLRSRRCRVWFASTRHN